MGAGSDSALPKQLRTAFERGGEMGRRMLELDWASTPLGPPQEWPAALQNAVATMLASRAQIVIFYGPGLLRALQRRLHRHDGRQASRLSGPARPGDVGRGVVGAAGPVRRRGRAPTSRTGRRPPLHARAVRLPRGDLLRHLVRPDPDRRRLGRRRVLHRHRDHRPGARRAPGPDPQRAGLPAGRPGGPGRRWAREVAEVLGENDADVPFAALYLDDPGDGGELALAGASGVAGAFSTVARRGPVDRRDGAAYRPAGPAARPRGLRPRARVGRRGGAGAAGRRRHQQRRRAGRRAEPVPRAWTGRTPTSSTWPPRRSPGRWPICGRTSRSAAGPPSWPRWTPRRPTSSPTSATSSVPR